MAPSIPMPIRKLLSYHHTVLKLMMMPLLTLIRLSFYPVGKTFIAPPQNMTVTRGSNVTISCEHVIASSSPVTWIINGTSFSQDKYFSVHYINRIDKQLLLKTH